MRGADVLRIGKSSYVSVEERVWVPPDRLIRELSGLLGPVSLAALRCVAAAMNRVYFRTHCCCKQSLAIVPRGGRSAC